MIIDDVKFILRQSPAVSVGCAYPVGPSTRLRQFSVMRTFC